MRSARLVILVDITDGDVVALAVERRDPAVQAHPAAGSDAPTPRPILRFPKAHRVRAAVAELVLAARLETHPCTPC